MNISIAELTAMVAARLGALPDWLWRMKRGEDAGEGALSLGDMVEALAAAEAVALTLEAGETQLDLLRDGRGAVRPSLDLGEEDFVAGTLPADCLRLVSLRLRGWKTSASASARIKSGSAGEGSAGDGSAGGGSAGECARGYPIGYGGLWRRRRRGLPMLELSALSAGPGDAGREFRASPKGEGEIAELVYAPTPCLEQGHLRDLSPRLLLPLADRIAQRLLTHR